MVRDTHARVRAAGRPPLLGVAVGVQMRAPETRRTHSEAPSAVGERPPPPLESVTAIEMVYRHMGANGWWSRYFKALF